MCSFVTVRLVVVVISEISEMTCTASNIQHRTSNPTFVSTELFVVASYWLPLLITSYTPSKDSNVFSNCCFDLAVHFKILYGCIFDRRVPGCKHQTLLQIITICTIYHFSQINCNLMGHINFQLTNYFIVIEVLCRPLCN